jgi:hypothetical protein
MQEDLDIDSGIGLGEGGGQLLLGTYLQPVTVFASEPPPQAQESFLEGVFDVVWRLQVGDDLVYVTRLGGPS